MFHSEMLARVIQADRVRDLERAAEDHRLLASDAKVGPTPAVPESQAEPRRVVPACTSDDAPAQVGGSTGVAA